MYVDQLVKSLFHYFNDFFVVLPSIPSRLDRLSCYVVSSPVLEVSN